MNIPNAKANIPYIRMYLIVNGIAHSPYLLCNFHGVRKSNIDTPQLHGGSEYIFSSNSYYISSKDITLYASNFNATGGILYAEFETFGGNKYVSSSSPIEVTTPPNPEIANNDINGNQTITEGNTASLINGSIPTGGNGVYNYNWEKKTTGTWGLFQIPTQKIIFQRTLM